MRSSKRTAGEPVDKLMRVRGTMSLVDKGTGPERSLEYDLALQEFQRALQLSPRNADSLIGLANSYENARHPTLWLGNWPVSE
jgi:hypothetical protein